MGWDPERSYELKTTLPLMGGGTPFYLPYVMGDGLPLWGAALRITVSSREVCPHMYRGLDCPAPLVYAPSPGVSRIWFAFVSRRVKPQPPKMTQNSPPTMYNMIFDKICQKQHFFSRHLGPKICELSVFGGGFAVQSVIHWLASGFGGGVVGGAFYFFCSFRKIMFLMNFSAKIQKSTPPK